MLQYFNASIFQCFFISMLQYFSPSKYIRVDISWLQYFMASIFLPFNISPHGYFIDSIFLCFNISQLKFFSVWIFARFNISLLKYFCASIFLHCTKNYPNSEKLSHYANLQSCSSRKKLMFLYFEEKESDVAIFLWRNDILSTCHLVKSQKSFLMG